MKFITRKILEKNEHANEARRQIRIQIALGERKRKLKALTLIRKTYLSEDGQFEIIYEKSDGQKRGTVEILPTTIKKHGLVTLRRSNETRGVDLIDKTELKDLMLFLSEFAEEWEKL